MIPHRVTNISLDFDRTFTADIEFWRAFVIHASARGHRIYCVTGRTDSDRSRRELERLFGPVAFSLLAACVFCDHRPKREVVTELGIHIDIWLDDIPEAIGYTQPHKLEEFHDTAQKHETLDIFDGVDPYHVWTPARQQHDYVPTREMILNFERRTHAHIQRVQRAMEYLYHRGFCREFLTFQTRAKYHDRSKFSPAEWLPYVWLTEYYRCKQTGAPFEYPPGMAERVAEATRRHVTTNLHHPEAHEHHNAMSELDLLEMVCDWTAMAEELESGSARPWADKTMGTRFAFTPSQATFIYELIAALDGRTKDE